MERPRPYQAVHFWTRRPRPPTRAPLQPSLLFCRIQGGRKGKTWTSLPSQSSALVPCGLNQTKVDCFTRTPVSLPQEQTVSLQKSQFVKFNSVTLQKQNNPPVTRSSNSELQKTFIKGRAAQISGQLVPTGAGSAQQLIGGHRQIHHVYEDHSLW